MGWAKMADKSQAEDIHLHTVSLCHTLSLPPPHLPTYGAGGCPCRPVCGAVLVPLCPGRQPPRAGDKVQEEVRPARRGRVTGAVASAFPPNLLPLQSLLLLCFNECLVAEMGGAAYQTLMLIT